jgi:hypothetical protein
LIEVHRHHAGLQEVLVVGQRIERRHHQRSVVVRLFPGKHLHRAFGIQGRVEASGLAFIAGGQRLIRLGALHLRFDEVRNLIAVLVYPGVGALVAPEVVERLLQRLHALVHGLFGVLLHARVDGSVHLQAVAV